MNNNIRLGLTDRRSLLRGAGALAVVAGLGALGLPLLGGSTRQCSIADLQCADFESLVNHSFRLYQQQLPLGTVQLVAVKNRLAGPVGLASRSGELFSLIFTGSQSEALLQDTYTFGHPALGRLDLFIVPAQVVDQEARYIATINRL